MLLFLITKVDSIMLHVREKTSIIMSCLTNKIMAVSIHKTINIMNTLV